MLTPIIALEEMKFDIISIAEMTENGSHERSLARNAARGICEQIDWTIATLKAAQEGDKNMGLTKTYMPQ